MMNVKVGYSLLLAATVALAAVTLNAQPGNPAHLTKGADDAPVADTLKPAKAFSLYVDKNGTISLPRNYRRNWAHLGSWAVAPKEGDALVQFHDVYTQPQTIDTYQQTGDYPDGAVLVKEVRGSQSHTVTTGYASSDGDIAVWFVMIRDRKGRYQGNNHWAEGWGWALFDAKTPGKEVSKGFSESCKTCHLPQKDDHWVFVFGYPDLKKQ